MQEDNVEFLKMFYVWKEKSMEGWRNSLQIKTELLAALAGV